MGKFAEELKQQGFSEAEIKQRIGTFEKLNAGDASPEDKRAAKLFRVGMDLEQAREFSKLGEREVNEIICMARERSLRGGALRRFFQLFKGKRIKPFDFKGATDGGRRK